MKFALITKKDISLAVILIIWLAVIAFVVTCTLSTTEVSSSERRIPVYSVDTDKRELALTFNCAWDDTGFDELMSLLSEENIKCTFFFVGSFCEEYPEVVKRIYEEGHEIGNHSMAHNDPVKQEYSDIVSDISLCNDALFSLTGEKCRLYRAPSGSYDNKTVEAAESLGMTAVQWDVDSVDWKNPTAEKIISRITENVQNGSIVLFHLGKENTVGALPEIIKILRNEGYSFTTVGDMLLEGEFFVDNSGRQKSV